MKVRLVVAFALTITGVVCGQTNDAPVSSAGLFSLAPVQLRLPPAPAATPSAPTNGEFTVVSEGLTGSFSPLLEKRAEWVVAGWTPAQSAQADRGVFMDRMFPSPASVRLHRLTIASGIQSFLRTGNPLTLIYPISISW